MNEVDRWIYEDGPEPEGVRPLLDAMRAVEPPPPDAQERMARAFFERLDASIAEEQARVRHAGPAADAARGAGVSSGPGPARRAEPRVEVREAPPLPSSGPGEPPAPPAAGLPPVVRAPAALTGTAMALDLPRAVWEQQGKLPFQDRAPPVPKSARTLKVPVMRAGLGETTPLGDDSITRAVAALPFAGSPAGAVLVQFPRLNLKQYASFRVELTERPDQTAAILRRYRVVSKAAHAALDAHWQKILAEDGQARAAFEKDVADFTVWVRTVPR